MVKPPARDTSSGGPPDRFLIRNTAVLIGTTGAVVALLLYPTSLSSTFTRATSAGSSGIVPLPSDVVVTGVAANTMYGPVQVQLRIRAGKIIQAKAIEYPTQLALDMAINSQALPVLNAQVVTSQSARIDTVSGATYTSGGYRHSLQSAIDQAHLG